MNYLSWNIISKPDNICKVENLIEVIMEKLHIPEKLYGRISLSIIETITNLILFGNNSQKALQIYVVKRKQKIVITVESDREKIDFDKLTNSTDLSKLMDKTWRGMYLMTCLPDELTFAKNGAKIVMTFFLNNR